MHIYRISSLSKFRLVQASLSLLAVYTAGVKHIASGYPWFDVAFTYVGCPVWRGFLCVIYTVRSLVSLSRMFSTVAVFL